MVINFCCRVLFNEILIEVEILQLANTKRYLLDVGFLEIFNKRYEYLLDKTATFVEYINNDVPWYMHFR